MSDTTTTEAAAETSGDSTETTEVTATETKETATTEVRDPEKLLNAYEAEKAKRKEQDSALRDLRTELDAIKAKSEGKEAEYAAQQEAQRIKDEALSVANQRILKSEVKAAAKGVLADPQDAYKFLDLDSFEVDADGNVDEATIAQALTDLVAAKPYLGAQGGQRFKGTADGGARTDASKPSQLTRADMARMSPEEIDAAHTEGRFTDLLGSR